MNLKLWAVGSLASAALLAPLAGPAKAQVPTGAPPAAQPALASVAATVNGEPVSMAELEAVLKLDGPPALEVPESKRRQKRLEVLGMLMDDLLMQQFLRKNGPRVDPAEVQKQITDLEQALAKQGKKLPDFLRESGQTEAQLRTSVVNLLQWRDYVKGRVTEINVKQYWEENKDFFDRVQVRASHIVVRLNSTVPAAEVQAATDKLYALRNDILAGKIDFADAAKKHSQCPSAPNGGDIGFFPRKWVVEEAFAKAAFSLKIGEVSPVVRTDYGLHLIKVTERKAGEPSEYEKIKEEVREICVEDLRQKLLADERKAATIKINLP